MSTTLLKTKLYRPVLRPNLVLRPRLMQRLDAGLSSKLTVVCAPAGYGKTTLVSAWASQCKCPVAWLSLDGDDNDPARFLTYLVSAARTIKPDLGREILGSLQSALPPAQKELLAVLVNHLDDIQERFVLVLDDYHLVTSPEIHKALGFIIDHQPPQMHVLIASRLDPALALPHLRGRGQLTELRQADLRFTIEEARAFLKQETGLALSDDDVATLMGSTEGWIAGLQMAVLSVQGKEDASRFIAGFGGSHEYIVDYFASEILARQSEKLKSFLLHTSILEQLCGSLCDFLTGQTGGEATLEWLREANLFVFPIDHERYWYRFHPLFRDLLQKQLLHEQPGIVAGLHAKASQWYEQHGLARQAFHHALSAGDPQSVARLVDANVESFWALGEFCTVQRWIEALTEDQLRRRPEVEIYQAMLLAYDGKIQEAGSLLGKVDLLLEARKSQAPEVDHTSKADEWMDTEHLHEAVSVAHAWVASFGQDPHLVLKYAHPALESMPQKTDPRDVPWLGSLYIALGNAYLQLGEQEAAIQHLSEAVELGKSNDNYNLVLTAMTKTAIALWAQGHLNRAARVCQAGLQYIDQKGLGGLPVISSLLITWGFVQCQWGELDQAEKSMLRGLELSRLAEQIAVQFWANQELTILMISKGDLPAAELYLQHSASLAEQHPIPVKFKNSLAGLKILIHIARGRLAEAEEDLRLLGIYPEGETGVPNLFFYICLSRLLIAKGELLAAEKLLERLLPVCQSAGQAAFSITIYKSRSLVYLARGELPPAMDSLQKAIELAEPDGYIQTFLDDGEPVRRLLRELVHRQGQTAFTRKLLAAFPGDASAGKAFRIPQALVEPLSARELEVLRLVADGLSNQEIAARLYLSLRTVKFHTSNIYTKLGVKNRTEAVSRARSLGLLI